MVVLALVDWAAILHVLQEGAPSGDLGVAVGSANAGRPGPQGGRAGGSDLDRARPQGEALALASLRSLRLEGASCLTSAPVTVPLAISCR